jgi:hypothetical protein
MNSITLTTRQTKLYDTDEQVWRKRLRPELYAAAQHKADDLGETVELLTHDGIVIEAFYPQ